MVHTEIAADSASCVFCAIAKGEVTPEVLACRDDHTAVFPSLYQRPRNQGHMLVVPAVHVAQIYAGHERPRNQTAGAGPRTCRAFYAEKFRDSEGNLIGTGQPIR